ncbi:putative RNA pseudouridine synthase [Candidatus Hodgkinia cicadicola Dsem]|nr:putative RNA pseudouridine synthase [Candidatus Hodgkinia cicadicola Dsem]
MQAGRRTTVARLSLAGGVLVVNKWAGAAHTSVVRQLSCFVPAHRIDALTSGLLVLERKLARLRLSLRRKTYLCLSHDAFAACARCRVTTWIRRRSAWKCCVSYVACLEAVSGLALLGVTLVTGRNRQLRRQLALASTATTAGDWCLHSFRAQAATRSAVFDVTAPVL